MSLQDEIREDLAVEVFGEFGKVIQRVVKSVPVTNDWGEVIENTETTSNITVVPYDIVQDRRNPQPFGDLQEGDMAVAVPWNVTVNRDDILIIEGERYKVSEISKNYLPDNVVTILRISLEEARRAANTP